jgi:carboxymethylenebutenolidase
MPQRTESVDVSGGSFDLMMTVPGQVPAPGLVLVQEIFGVGDYIEAVAADLAGLGYLVAAPDLFWRLKPRHRAGHDQAGLAESLELAGQFDLAQGVADTVAALRTLAGLPECDGRAGLLGFCLGGSIAFMAAAQADPAAAVSYYGSAVPDQLAALGQISCPLQFEFGGNDPYLQRDKVREVEAAAAGHPNVELHVEEDAGHAFHNRVAPMFYQPEPAARAWQRTEDFLRRHLGLRS